jgi:hypothetical protein
MRSNSGYSEIKMASICPWVLAIFLKKFKNIYSLLFEYPFMGGVIVEDIILKQTSRLLTFVNQGTDRFPFVEMFINGQYAGAYSMRSKLSIPVGLRDEIKRVELVGYMEGERGTFPFHKQFVLNQSEEQREKPKQDFQAGDILVACDNVNGLPYGYMGHSALVVDENNMIESVASDPYVRKAPISQLTDYHPIYAQFRPKNQELGKKAAAYAENYLVTYQKNKENGIDNPLFYFSLNVPLTDEWTYIYCSKLVWLSYHYGANYTFTNDHLWFAPEDLYTQMSTSSDFELIYKHPNYKFIIDM